VDSPPPRERDVLQWLDENDATVLVTDWKLNEGSKGRQVVTYEADRLIREIRSNRPSFPIFVITGFASEAQSHLKDVENIFSRESFTKGADSIVPQMLRAGQRRYDEQRELLDEWMVLHAVLHQGRRRKRSARSWRAAGVLPSRNTDTSEHRHRAQGTGRGEGKGSGATPRSAEETRPK